MLILDFSFLLIHVSNIIRSPINTLIFLSRVSSFKVLKFLKFKNWQLIRIGEFPHIFWFIPTVVWEYSLCYFYSFISKRECYRVQNVGNAHYSLLWNEVCCKCQKHSALYHSVLSRLVDAGTCPLYIFQLYSSGFYSITMQLCHIVSY